ncbi:COMM domain-containing protein 4 isoform X1 [Trichoplusia ni]|uniref:COMM domain-containing protein 4 isoform X1 n=1 Tax=Trichoplusia ni TaxID=7111 RepID=A0A7E5W4B3_TRINI|nr:COMM domain-containing protein 4 isoform X1 [Trichoplusia ni]
MKFKFCSDGDVPLWALAGLNGLSTLPATVFRELVQHVMDERCNDNHISVILKDTDLTTRDEKARAAVVIRWVLDQSLSCAVTGQHLMRDLLVLGVPRTHASALSDAVDQFKIEPARQEPPGFVLDKVIDIHVKKGPSGTVDTESVSLETQNPLTAERRRLQLLFEKSKALTLLEDLKMAYMIIQAMEEVESEKIAQANRRPR